MTLVAREFPISMTLRLWDTLLADHKRFSFLHYVNCALIRCQKHVLLQNGFTKCLQILQALPNRDLSQILIQAEQMRDKDRSIDDHRKQVTK